MPAKSAHKKSKHWKSFQSDEKVKQKTKLAVLVLVLIVLIIVVGQTFKFVIGLQSPKTAHLSVARNYHWNSKTPLNVILKNSSGELGILSYDPKEELISLLTLPENSQVGQTKGSVDAIKKSMTDFFGLPMESYLEITHDQGTKPLKDITDTIRKNPIEAIAFYLNSKTDLTPAELISLIYKISNTRFDKIQVYELASLELLDESKTDSGAVLAVSTARLDTFVTSKLMDKILRDEQATIAIYNATQTPGLAARLSRIITNMGGNVIFASNASSESLKKSYLTQKEAPEYSSKRLQELFTPNCPPEAKCDILEDSDIVTSRAQINIVLGSDVIGKF